MDHKEWFDCGAQIGDLVEKAVDSHNFQSLSQSIADTVNDTINSIQDSIKESQEAQRRAFAQGQKGTTYRAQGKAYQQSGEKADSGDASEHLRKDRDFKGLFSMVAGYGAAVISGAAGLLFVLLFAITGWGLFGIPAFLFLILAAVFAIAGARGGSYRTQRKRLQQYLKIMNGRDTVTLQELASGTGQSVRQVKKDIRNMIQQNMFDTPAYLDEQETALMTSREAYRQYQETMTAWRRRQAQEKAKRPEQTDQAGRSEPGSSGSADADQPSYSEETQKILREGQEFTRHIHECNEKIQDPAMSEKLDRLEAVVSRIFRQVAQKPDSAPDLHRMMNYYLPITRKLIDVYADLDSQDLTGENVTNTKEEIEKSLDTINAAFETFLDSFYQDTAWDISSDISALRTMMARDGLTQNGDFSRTRTVSRDVGAAAAASQEKKKS